MVNVAWFCFKWAALLAVLGALAAAPFFYDRLNEEIRRRVEKKLADHYAGLSVTVRSAQRIDGEGIEIRGVSIFEHGAAGPQAELLYIDELFVKCDTDLLKLVEPQLELEHLTFRRAVLRLTRRPDGTWSGARLLPLPQFSAKPPVATIENATVEIFDPTKNPSSTLRLRDANCHLKPVAGAAPNAQGKVPMQLTGFATGDHFRQLGIDATFDPSGAAWQMSGNVDALEISSDAVRSLPGNLPSQCGALEALRAQTVANFKVRYDPRLTPAFDFEVRGKLQRGRLDDPRLPYPLTEMRAEFHCDSKGCAVKELTARSGQATLRLKAHRKGYDALSPLELQASARGLMLDARLLDILPERLKVEWHRFLPSGEVDLDANVAFDGKTWLPDVYCKCLNASFSYHKFPYRLERARGTIELKQGLLKTNLVAATDSAELRLVSEFQILPTPGPGWLEVRGDALRFDEKLLRAMSGPSSAIVRSLNPYGKFNLVGRFWREADGIEHRDLAINLSQCALRFDKFPYPLDNIRGTIEMHDGAWTFHDLHGANGTARVACSGQLLPSDSGQHLALRFTGTQVLLEEELRDALSPAGQQLWNALKPQGSIDVETEVRFDTGNPNVGLWVRAEPNGQSVSIDPAPFPYRLDKMSGVFVLDEGKVMLQGLRGEHGRTRVSANGGCDLHPDGGWHLKLENMSVDRLWIDRDLIQAVPTKLRKTLADLRATGAVNLRGSFELASNGNSVAPLASGWDVQIDLQQNNADLGVWLENMTGGLHLVGNACGDQFRCRGQVQLDSVAYKDIQFTELQGPLWLDETRLLLGFWADRLLEAKPERHLTARLYGGTCNLDGWVQLGSQPKYEFQAQLAGGDLARWKQETLGGHQRLSGEMQGQVAIRGEGRSLNNLGGRGSLELRNADIYELNFMVALLKILSIRAPDATAFTSSDIKFRIEGEHIYVDTIDFNGDAVSLLGKGEIDFNKQVHLTFHAMVGQEGKKLPMVKNVLGGASQQLMLIHADGQLDSPVMSREAFPVVNQALQTLQTGIQPQAR